MKYFLLLVLLVSCGAKPRSYEDYRTCLDNFVGWNHPEKVTLPTLDLACELKKYANKRGHVFTPISDWRPKSQHPKGKAFDFIASDFRGLSFCSKIDEYYSDIYLVEDFLVERGLTNLVGWGIYDGFSIHLDTRGQRARWARLNDRYVSFNEGLDWLAYEWKRCRGIYDHY